MNIKNIPQLLTLLSLDLSMYKEEEIKNGTNKGQKRYIPISYNDINSSEKAIIIGKLSQIKMDRIQKESPFEQIITTLITTISKHDFESDSSNKNNLKMLLYQIIKNIKEADIITFLTGKEQKRNIN